MTHSTPAFAEAGAGILPQSAARGVAVGAALLALACVLGLVESSLPPVAFVPWLRLGLANIAIVLALETSGAGLATLVSGGRLLVVGVATGSLAGPAFAMAFAGASASLAVMVVLRRAFISLSPVGWSAAGSVAHVLGQLAVAAVLLQTGTLVSLMPPSALVALVLGAAVGAVSRLLISRLPLGQA